MVLLAVLVGLGLLHSPILQLLGWPLVAQGVARSRRPTFTAFKGASLGPTALSRSIAASGWYYEAPNRKILLLLPPDSRIVEVGAMRSFEWMCRSELDKRGIPASDVLSIRTRSSDVWGGAHALADWLAAHPGVKVLLACNRMDSGLQHYVFEKSSVP